MKTIINHYLAYDKVACHFGDEAYNFGSELAKKAIYEGYNPYEVMSIVIDNICSAFCVERVKYSVNLRKSERDEKRNGKTKV